jgi:hypothetical protein
MQELRELSFQNPSFGHGAANSSTALSEKGYHRAQKS